ncbi:vWA domain-containing protein [Luteibaculum oceani]|uniref:VWA domain-containing protein n=1 Tax=Luteibaculum oceani TaxID=1294296 RepID=A0A5C6UT84_9FLAO|nr:VWA domain-containing protein [Luteibaculum oceani]TXC76179.1 VWA domain-containing protein [Luteibaculum oceani]
MGKSKIGNIVFALIGVLLCFILWQYYYHRFEYKHGAFFWFLPIIPLLAIHFVWRQNQQIAKVNLPSFNFIAKENLFSKGFFRTSLHGFKWIALTLLIIALARPQSKDSYRNVSTEGIDIIIALDVSASMLAKDFTPNRLESAKDVAMDFISKRTNDRIGLVVYEGEAFTQCPITTDHRVLNSMLKEINTGLLEGGTAIGMGLATSVNRLRESDAKSKVIILLTDGVNNRGEIDPITSAELAKEFGVKVYTIGVGSRGKALSPVSIYPNGQYKYEYIDVKIDELTLEKIAFQTGGKYYRATSEAALREIYDNIDKLEKTEIKVTEYAQRNEEFAPFILAALALLCIEIILKSTWFRSIP